jgi:uncharacterized lipoprotein YddW (UPF0748 family)
LPAPPSTPLPAAISLPDLPREFRGVWVATVGNMDWPSRSAMGDPAKQRAELVAILDRARQMRLNAVVFQIRASGDALYRSKLEPWSKILTGQQGTDPGYDPLQFAIDEAHRRGLELHAWFNPFRASTNPDASQLASTHFARRRPDLIRTYDRQLWMNPGESEVQDWSMSVFLDVVSRYDVDAVHIDDYFYPYLNPRAASFPDASTFQRYRNRGGTLTLGDWRRDNINRFVERLYREVHARKPMVRVGISPFGIWRPNSPPGIDGLDSYTEIFADSKLWFNNGWMDYLAPQLYWRIDPPSQSYPVLLDWWIGQNRRGRHIYAGNASYRVADGSSNPFSAREIVNQVLLTRARRGAGGNLFFNATSLMQDQGGVSSQLQTGPYSTDALVPASPWLDPTPPGRPTVVVSAGSGAAAWSVTLQPDAGDLPRWWLLRTRAGGKWASQLLPGTARTIDIPAVRGVKPDVIAINEIDMVGNLGEPEIWRGP